jgi:large subunit ribosomal protein L28
MSRICEITGKKAIVGNKVSHAKNKTKRWFNINISKKKFFFPKTKKWIYLNVSTSGVRIINKIGIEKVLNLLSKKKIYGKKKK